MAPKKNKTTSLTKGQGKSATPSQREDAESASAAANAAASNSSTAPVNPGGLQSDSTIPVNPGGESIQTTPSEKVLGKRKRTESESLPPTTSQPASSKDMSKNGIHPPLHALDFAPEKGSCLDLWMNSREKTLKKVDKCMPAKPIEQPVVYLRDLFDEQIVDNRNFVFAGFKNPPAKEIKFITKGEVFQLATFIDEQEDNESEKPREILDIELWETCTPKSRKAEMHEVADKVCHLLNRMPVGSLSSWFRPTRSRGSQAKRHVFMEAYRKIAVVYTAARNTFPGNICTIPYKIPMGTSALNEGNISIDATEEIFHLCPTAISADIVIPAVPTIMAFDITDKKKKISNANRATYNRGFDMLKSAIWQLFGAVGSVNAVKRKIAEVTTLTGRGDWFPGPCIDRSIWTSVSNRIRLVDIGKLKDTKAIKLDTRARNQVVFVLETILQEWYQNSGILNAWHAGQVAAYKLQYDALSPDFACEHDMEHSDTHGHVCSVCYRVWNCSLMTRAGSHTNDLRVCPRCFAIQFDGQIAAQKVAADVAEINSLGASKVVPKVALKVIAKPGPRPKRQMHGDSSVLETANRLWLQNLYHEKRCFPDLKALLPTLLEVRQVTQELFCNEIWRDFYTLKERLLGDVLLPGLNPFQPSPDAIFPYTVVENCTVYHGRTNVCFTALYLNYMKNQYNPGILGLVSEAQALRNKETSDPKWIDLMRRFDHQFCLTAQTPKAKSKRLGQEMSAAEYERQKSEWISGQYKETHIEVFQDGSRAKVNWRPQGYERIEKIISQLEDHFQAKIPRNEDGVPWLWLIDHLPKDWNWRWLWLIFTDRVKDMTKVCNKYWVTVDDEESLFLEYIRQLLKGKGRDVFFSLEMTILPRHPLRFAVAHMHHGEQMRTGWTNRQPKDFYKDYDENLCNILFETQLSNFAKSDFDEGYYPYILEDIKEIPLEHDMWSRVESPVPQIKIKMINHQRAAEQTPGGFIVDDDDENDSDVVSGDED